MIALWPDNEVSHTRSLIRGSIDDEAFIRLLNVFWST
jgi:hypothetical protein